MDTAKSTNKVNPKPENIFYVWYTELCRRVNCTPAPVVKPARTKCRTVLEFVADRLKVEEWNPIINALRHDTSLHVINIKSRIGKCQFLHDVDTESKAKNMKRRFGSLWTAYVLQQLIKSLSQTIRNTQVLTVLELDGLPMFCQYLEPLLQAFKKNTTIKTLSFANSTLHDAGCQLVCTYLRSTPNIEVINLSGCGLTAESGKHLAKLIKHQQINRYCESWHNSLRYEDPESGFMRGIKRISLNCNSNFGDQGFNHILDELEDDLWIKALDLQKCGLTENLASKLIYVMEYNKSLEIVDIRHNMFDISTVENVLKILRNKHLFGQQPEFQWCTTAVTLSMRSAVDSVSKLSLAPRSTCKTKSEPVNKPSPSTALMSCNRPVRKARTIGNIPSSHGDATDIKRTQYEYHKVYDLNVKLNEEIKRRQEMERCNKELRERLDKISCGTKDTIKPVMKKSLTTLISRTGIKSKDNRSSKTIPTNFVTRKCKGASDNMSEKVGDPVKNGYHKRDGKVNIIMKNGIANGMTCNGLTNGHKNGFTSKVMTDASKIFANLVQKGYTSDGLEDEVLLNYYADEDSVCEKTCTKHNEVNAQDDISGSQASLYEYMEELKGVIVENSSSLKNNNCTSKLFIKENAKR